MVLGDIVIGVVGVNAADNGREDHGGDGQFGCAIEDKGGMFSSGVFLIDFARNKTMILQYP